MTTHVAYPLWRPTVNPEVDEGYEKPQQETKILAAGWRLTHAHAPFQVQTVWEKNVPVKMRDGCQIYVDVFRPQNSTADKVPALLAWSPYGKSACHTGGWFYSSKITPPPPTFSYVSDLAHIVFRRL